jgi:putative glutamine amidotransferase
MKKSMIAVTPIFDDEKDSIWMLPGYMDAITKAGGIPVILPLIHSKEDIHTLVNQFDGFLFTGGHDVNPEMYNEEKLSCCGDIHYGRDSLESVLIRQILNYDKPLLGICRGLQFLNAALGGTLYQDINKQKDSELQIIHKQSKPYDIPSHRIQIENDSLLFKIVNHENLMVNSCHHQAIKKLSPQLICAAKSEDMIIESAYMPNKKFVLGVQWHPEFLYETCEDQFNIFKTFISLCN